MKECRNADWLRDDGATFRCPECGGPCSAVTLRPGMEVCNAAGCQTLGLIPTMRDRWWPFLPMRADYEVGSDGKKKLLGWHPASKPDACYAVRRRTSDGGTNVA